jgi:hypothetical protein
LPAPRPLFTGLLALGIVLIYAPAIYLLLASLNPGMQRALVSPSEFSLTWYRPLLGDSRLLSALMESLIVGVATATVATPIGLSAALAFRAMSARGAAVGVLFKAAQKISGHDNIGQTGTGIVPSTIRLRRLNMHQTGRLHAPLGNQTFRGLRRLLTRV